MTRTSAAPGFLTRAARWAAFACSALLAAFGAPAVAQVVRDVPPALQGVGITQKLDASIPLDLTFTDENGRAVRLQDYFGGKRPVLLSLVYYRCPMLCTLVLDGMVDALQEIDWLPGREFEIVTVSIDPREDAKLARVKKQNYIQSYGRPEAAPGWHFLTGPSESISALADAVGFSYQYMRDSKEFAHSAALFVITPEGRISRYLLGIHHEPRTVRLALVEASEGKIGSVVDQFLLFCYRYNAVEGRYTPVAWKLMRVGGVLTVVIFAAALLIFWRREAGLRRVV